MSEVWIAAAATAVVGAGASVYGSNQQAKAAKQAAEAGRAAQVDIGALDAQARALSKRNLADSAALEKQFNPEVEALRRQATESLLGYTTGPDTTRNTLKSALYSDFNKANIPLSRSALLDEAVAKARTDLGLGGRLSTSTRNEITRRAGASAAGVGGGVPYLGRDISARDLGLSALDLENRRLQAAGAFAAQDQSFLDRQAQLSNQNFDRRLSTASLLSDLDSQTFGQRMALAQFGQSLARPESGLDPSSLVNLTVGNSNASSAAGANAAAIRAQQGANTAAAGGQLLGLAGGLYANRTQTQSKPNQQKGVYVEGATGGYKDPDIIGTYYR
jgi:hypothetical protein